MEVNIIHLLALAGAIFVLSAANDDKDLLQGVNLTVRHKNEAFKPKKIYKLTDGKIKTCIRITGRMTISIDLDSRNFTELVIQTKDVGNGTSTELNATFSFPNCKKTKKTKKIKEKPKYITWQYTCPKRPIGNFMLSKKEDWSLCSVELRLKFRTKSPSPCVEGRNRCANGTCRVGSNHTAECDCQPGYTGKLCQDECEDGKYGHHCMSNCSSGCSVGTCNKSNGECTCRLGYKGEKCNGKCSVGTYGNYCMSNCSTGCKDKNCNKADGRCHCKPGWSGSQCSQECDANHYGVNCSNECSKGCINNTCDDETGKCQCLPGRRGEKCTKSCGNGTYGTSCSKNCSDGCSHVCDKSDGYCLCKDGWKGLNCIEECEDGKYGHHCMSNCSSGCSVGTCNKSNGECTCRLGYKGEKCNGICDKDKYGRDCNQTCSSGCLDGRCKSKDGTCSCEAGWKGKRCHRECEGGTYGDYCTSNCSRGCSTGMCNNTSGVCTCRPGYIGDNCNQACPDGSYGHNCNSSCSEGCVNSRGRCNYETGYCTCKAGWEGNKCETACSNRTYGPGCNSTCSEGCNDRTCDIYSGTCTCRPGWMDDKCATKCRSGNYGVNCTRSCSKGCKKWNCNRKNGSCSCKAGFTGTKCDGTCASGKYGRDCKSSCSNGCQHGQCDRDTGKCTCKSGWKGDRCIIRCDNTHFGQDCVNECGQGCAGSTCDSQTGICSCTSGWTGKQCNKVCDKKRYGVNCSKTCSIGCVRERCKKQTGKCSCQAGWEGNKCQKPCENGYYGINCTRQCKTCLNGNCSKIDGRCRTCVPGWKGRKCDRKCNHGQFGSDCRESCSYGCVNHTCSRSTGDCECVPGWGGTDCSQRCPRGTYGANCTETCSDGCYYGVCDPANGRCRCDPSWNGPLCEQKIASSQLVNPNHKLILHIVGACAMFVIILAVGSAIIFLRDPIERWRKGNGSTPPPEKKTPRTAETDETAFNRCNQEPSLPTAGTQHRVSQTTSKTPEKDVGNNERASTTTDKPVADQGHVRFSIWKSQTKKDKQHCQKSRRILVPPGNNHVPSGEDKDASALSKKVSVTSENADLSNDNSASRIEVKNVEAYLAHKMSRQDALKMEYNELPRGLCASHVTALTPENNVKNRFKGIYPYDHTRVCLNASGNHGDYINANYIVGPSNKRQYIATQGPLANTIRDFWQMVWQNHCPVIVMLTNLKENEKVQCEQYWLDKGVAQFGNWRVMCEDICQLANYTIRTLNIQKDKGNRMTVKHVHYTVWPDKSVPRFPMTIVELRKKVRDYCDFDKGPVLVHCSAGVGRTGTLIALDYLLQEAEEQGCIDIYACVWKLRTQRLKMVQTEEQYVILHECLLEALEYTVPSVKTENFVSEYGFLQETINDSEMLAAKFEKLNSCPTLEIRANVARYAENLRKNRNFSIVPDDRDRALLTTEVEGRTDYINAVVVPSFKKQRAYILTQTPLQSTVIDFWRLIHDYHVVGIVMLDTYTHHNTSDCGVYWPEIDHPCQCGPFTVTIHKTHKHQGFIEEVFKSKISEETREVTVFRPDPWNDTTDIPKRYDHFLSLIEYIRQWNPSTAPILVHCRDGATRCGLFCVVASIQEQILVAREVSVDQAIRTIRNIRKDVIATVNQYIFCHEVLLEYLGTS